MPRRKKEDEIILSESERIPRGAANARERTRMRVLSKAFGRLKLTLPWVPPDTKLSKLDTLRLATSYISHLKRILHDEDDEDDDGEVGGGGSVEDEKSRINMSCWPYGHHRLSSIPARRLEPSSTHRTAATTTLETSYDNGYQQQQHQEENQEVQEQEQQQQLPAIFQNNSQYEENENSSEFSPQQSLQRQNPELRELSRMASQVS